MIVYIILHRFITCVYIYIYTYTYYIHIRIPYMFTCYAIFIFVILCFAIITDFMSYYYVTFFTVQFIVYFTL